MNANVKQGSMWINQSNVNQLTGKKNLLVRKCFKWALAKSFILGLLAIMLCILSHAQEVMKIGSYIDVQRQYKKYIDMVLPTVETLPFGWIYLEARGGDGGRRYLHNLFYDVHYGNGGEGAILGGWVKIAEDAEGCIPPGSKIRFIIGEHGKSCNNGLFDEGGASGGGGTGILFLPPNANNGEWQHLIIAGAGGGANLPTFGRRDGQGGHADSDEPSGEASVGLDITNAAGWKYGSSKSGAESGWRLNYGDLADWADWVKGYGKLKDISVAYDGTVWGVGHNNEIYRRSDDNNDRNDWEKVPGAFRRVSVADDGTVWGVNSDNKIYRRKDDDSEWEKVLASR